jgi:predicted DNA-binding protein
MKKVLFNLTEDQYERLQTLSNELGMSKSETLRRAIVLYQMIKEAQQEGAEFTKRDKAGDEKIVEFIG